MNSSKKISQKNPKLGEKGKERKVPTWEHPELVPVQNRAKRIEEMEKEKRKNIIVEYDDELEEEENNFGDLYEVAPEMLEIEYPKKRYSNTGSVRTTVKTKGKLLSSSSNKRGINLRNGSIVAEEGDSLRQLQSRGETSGPLRNRAQRRESFLYRMPSEEVLKQINHFDQDPGEEEDQIVTPFAQILATLKDVRSNLATMVSMQVPTENGQSVSGSSKAFLDKFRLSNAGATKVLGILGVETLESMDWCLDQLEHLKTNKGVADMAADKFKMMLNRELSVLSQSSKEGKNISNHITSTYYEHQHQHEFTEEDEVPEDSHIVVWKEDSSGAGNSVHAKAVSKVQAARDLTASTNRGMDGFTSELTKITNLNTWGLDVFTANKIIKDQRVLTCTTFKIFQERDLLKTFKIAPKTLLSFLMTLEDHYLQSVPYHNHLHAADVTQSTHILMQSTALEEVFTPLEAMAAILACAAHDVDHPGVTNQYLINTSSELAVMYNDESVLENHHLAVAFKLLQIPDCDILSNLSQKQRMSVRKMVIDMVLATDMSKHMSLLADLKTMVETKKVAGSGVLNLDNYNDRIQVLQNMIHCSDLSNPTKPLNLYVQWVDRLMEEFWKQGDKERVEGLEISPMCDRENATIEKSQVGFISYIVYPLWETWAELVFPDAQQILTLLESNRTHYEGLLPKEA